MKILLVEDEKKVAFYLQKGLNENGFIVDIAYDGKDGIYYATTQQYDLIILDILLPHISGLTILTTVRQSNINTPVLLLTAKDAIQDKVNGLNLGADDYLIKPFSFSELLARVRALLRRPCLPVQPDVIQIADLEIHLLRQRALRKGKNINLTAKEFNLLVLLARHQGHPISRTFIAEQVWDMNFDSDTNVVDVSIARLRQKIDSIFDKRLIHTIRGVGYVLEAK